MKKLVLITGIILLACLFTGVYASPDATVKTENAISGDVNAETGQAFVIKSENNHIVVYKKGENSPFMTTDTTVSSLPKGDIMLLEKGIEVSGEENLKRSLEDFCS